MLQEAIDAIRQGQKGRAREILGRLLRSDPNNVEYWLWMSGAVATTKEQIFCLQNVLRLDPENKTAKKGLVLLGVVPPEAELTPAPVVVRDWKASVPESAAKIGEQTSPTRRVLVLGGLAALLVVSLLVWFFGIRPRLAVHAPAPVAIHTKGVLPTYTSTPTFIARATETVPVVVVTQRVVNGATAPATSAPLYTSTPLYVNTPHPVNEAYRIGLRAFAIGDWQTALTNMQQAASTDAGAVDIQYYIGESLRNMGDNQDALKAFKRALEIDENFAPAYLGRARTRLALDPNADILADLQQATTKDPAYGEAFLELASYYLSKKDAKSARELAEKAGKLLPESPLVYLYQGQSALLLGEYKVALQSAQRALKLDSTLLPAQLLLGQAALHTDELELASETLRQYTNSVAGDTAGWLALGETSFRMGLYADALISLDQALEIDDRLPEAYLYRGLARLEVASDEAGKQDAVEDLTVAVRYAPRFIRSQFGPGTCVVGGWPAERSA